MKDAKRLLKACEFSGSEKTMEKVNKGLFLLMAWILFLPAACANLPVSHDGSMEMAYQIPRVAPEELKRFLDGGAEIIVVDTMPSEWYQKGHIKGAVNYPWREPLVEPDNLLPRNKLLVIYCDCPNEETSADVAQQLSQRWKYENIQVLKGGWDKWVRLGYPTEKGKAGSSKRASF